MDAHSDDKVILKVPATSANCGPGFDCLGVACTLYNVFSFERIPQGFELVVEGEGQESLEHNENNLVFAAFNYLWQKNHASPQGLRVYMRNNIPLARGLGSSSTAIVAGVMAANELLGKPYSKEELVDFATVLEGHPDNVAPALLGGFTISFMQDGVANSLRFEPRKPFKLVAVVPDMPLATVKARAAIPPTVAHKDAVFNAGRTALLVGALLTGDYTYLGTAMEDKLHQPFRESLIPGMKGAFQAAREAGAYNAIISGAGSTLMAYVPSEVVSESVGEAMLAAFKEVQMKAVYHVLDIDKDGAVVI